MKLDDERIYEGEIWNNVPYGYGIESIETFGVIYEGYWEYGKYHCDGKLYYTKFGDASSGKAQFDRGFILGRVDLYNIYDDYLGYIVYDENDHITDVDLNYSSGNKRILKSSNYYDNQHSEIESIRCCMYEKYW